MDREHGALRERPGEPEVQEQDYPPTVGLRGEVRGVSGAGRLGPVLAVALVSGALNDVRYG